MLQAATDVGSINIDYQSKLRTTPTFTWSLAHGNYMHHCDTCGADFVKKEQLAGHNSAHVRRGEKPKRASLKLVYPKKCDECDFIIETPAKLGGHKRIHAILFDSLKCDDSRKNRLLIECGHRCQICSLSEWLNDKIPIEIDHIDGNPDNNVRSNLRLLCPNCHAMQPTHAGANARQHKGTKRQQVMSRYPSYRHHGHSVESFGSVV